MTPAFRSIFAVSKDSLTVGGWGWLGGGNYVVFFLFHDTCTVVVLLLEVERGMLVARNMDHGGFGGSDLRRCL